MASQKLYVHLSNILLQYNVADCEDVVQSLVESKILHFQQALSYLGIAAVNVEDSSLHKNCAYSNNFHKILE